MAKATQHTATHSVIEADSSPSSDPFVGQWHRLVTTTNWEKGRIICQWREALLSAAAPVTDYSDEAWAQLVGGVTSQHVGRLRRVFQRFGEEFEQYPGLYWSHFQASLDWDDAPMWLEGAIQNVWSISQMRGKRWETLGTPPAEQRAELAQSPDFDELPADVAAATQQEPAVDSPASGKTASLKSVAPDKPTRAQADDEADAPWDDQDVASAKSPAKRTPLSVDVELLSDDLADAFEQFKLAIIAQRRGGWQETSRATVIECLDALQELALAED